MRATRPGLILLQYLVADCADRGFSSFDIGPGEARYKSSFCKDLEPIFDSVLPLSARGHAAVLAVAADVPAQERDQAQPSFVDGRVIRASQPEQGQIRDQV